MAYCSVSTCFHRAVSIPKHSLIGGDESQIIISLGKPTVKPLYSEPLYNDNCATTMVFQFNILFPSLYNDDFATKMTFSIKKIVNEPPYTISSINC